MSDDKIKEIEQHLEYKTRGHFCPFEPHHDDLRFLLETNAALRQEVRDLMTECNRLESEVERLRQDNENNVACLEGELEELQAEVKRLRDPVNIIVNE